MSGLGVAFRRLAGTGVVTAAALAVSGAIVGVSAQAASPAQSTPLVFQAISAGTNHVCGITAQHVAYCWGRNADGELGNPSIAATCSESEAPCDLGR